eukprot:303128_1
MRIYIKEDNGNLLCPDKLACLHIIGWIYFVMCCVVIIINFVTDVLSVQTAAHRLNKRYNVAETTVEAIAFIQIVFENTLLTEYLHVIFSSIEHGQYKQIASDEEYENDENQYRSDQ